MTSTNHPTATISPDNSTHGKSGRLGSERVAAFIGARSQYAVLGPMDDLITQQELIGPILDTIGALVVILDTDGRIVRFNRACEKATGYDFTEVENRLVWELLLAPEEMGAVIAVFAELQAGLFPNQHRNRWITKKGDHRLIDWSNTAIVGDSGKVRYVVATGIDVTEQARAVQALKKSEEHLRSILETAPDAIITIDELGIVNSYSTHAEALFGYRASEVIGRNITMLMPKPYRDEHDGYIARYWKTGEKRIIGIGREVTARRKDGTIFPVGLSVNEMRIDKRRMFTGVIRDITEQRSWQEQLSQAQKMEAVGQLTGGLAHDFNNLLTVIIGNMEMLEARLDGDERSLSLISDAQEAAELGAELTGRLLAFARRQPLDPKLIDLNELVMDMRDLLQRTLGETIQVTTLLDVELWPTLADTAQVQNALLNLAVNARDAMPEGGRLTVETANAELDEAYARSQVDVSPGRYAMLSVTDSGNGMSPEVQERAFEPFFTTKAAGAGTGLGLSMVFGFAKQSGGHLRLYSKAGHGTTVSLYLPMNEEGIALETRADPLEGVPRARGELVLVVEDDPRVRRVTVNRLQELGYGVAEVDSGTAALAWLESSGSADLLFTDVVMPGGMTGHELAEVARQRYPGMPILFTSGYSKQVKVGTGIAGEDPTWLRKPYKQADLARKLRVVLDA